uniref:Basement membrane proteoglycan n=2 Tax=Mesocestoides corti TaxID=53468 RepID=A0A5K3FC60_MESCO
MRWLWSLPLLISALLSVCQAEPRHYQVNLRLRENSPLLELRCPLYHAAPGDVLVFSDMHQKAVMRVALREATPAPVLALPTESLNKYAKAFIFYCEVLEAKTLSLVSKTTFIVQRLSPTKIKVPVYDTFHYEPEEVDVLRVKLGETLQVPCPTKAAKVGWFRAAGEQVLHADSKTAVEVLHFASVKPSDLGVYYCGAHPTTGSHTSLTVKKFIVVGNENSVLTKMAKMNVTGDHEVVHVCPQPTDRPSPSDLVIWERPLGVVHLIYSGKRQITRQTPADSEKAFHCSVEGSSVQRALRSTDAPLVRARRSIAKPQFILREVGPGAKTATVECRWEGGENVRYEWLHDGQGVIGTEPQQEVNLATMLERGASHPSDDGERYICAVFDADSGEKLSENTFTGVTKFKQPELNSVELTEEPDSITMLYPDEQLEIHCDIPSSAPFRARDVDWYINGKKLGRVANRVDTGKSSILGYNEMTADRSGTYACRFGDTVLSTHLLVRERTVSINIEPKEDHKSSGINDAAEFHCRVSGVKNGGKDIQWSFIPEGSTDEESLPWDVETDTPAAVPATSFIYIRNPEKRHEGQYICRIRQQMDVARLIVEDKKITVNPEVVTARPGSTVRFFCSVTLQDGRSPRGGVTKVTWFRKDRNLLEPGREEIITGTSASNAAVLVVKHVDRNSNDVVYVCSDGFRTAEAKILIQEVCGPGERSCGGDKCIAENLFCNGVPDCPDGSDEIPERCRECEPNQYACLAFEGKEPSRFCYLRSWHCDGEDDCGNGFDESNCPEADPKTPCSNKFFLCPENHRPIPRSYLCDTQEDCEPTGSDETDCSRPSVIYPPRGHDVLGIKGTNVTLKCVIHGRPPPAINWRFNWGPIKTDVPYVENTTVEGCDRVTSYLTLINIDPRASGMYTCEGVTYQDRVLAPDYTVNVGAGTYCTEPKFNDAAWNEDMCLDCYCSGVSEACTSLRGYSLAPSDKVAKPSISDVRLVAYDSLDNELPGELQGLQLTDSTFTIAVPDANNTYLEGTFGLTGDWRQTRTASF